jgi:RNase P subunit RPR2
MNTYHDGKYISILKTWTKYYKMAGIGFVGLSAYLFFKKNPSDSRTMLSAASGLMKHIPMDRETASVINPIMDLTGANNSNSEQRIVQSGRATSKRSVSETKKKYVASQQDWKCKSCNTQLNAWFEVDHTIRIDQGGSNSIENLVALCRECHGKKTAFERF